MLQITEDTPPDMLAGAMDLIVHLPNGNSVKMSAERSTPMMDLLVQITTNHHLQLSGYTLQPLEMAPTTTTTTTTPGYCSDKILPFKPNTPIGVLDTQHIRVVPKIKTIPKTLQKSSSIISNNSNSNNHIINNNNNGYHQPFESTFRLKVYLPRNQLYVTRISQNVYLEDILKKVCDEKHLDPQKYEFRHPGNLDEILDPKLTLSDYQITELHLVIKGTIGLQQTFATNDLMTLRKEEERKQMHNKTGGGVFNLIFRRGKTSSGSVSSENRSISPTHSDDSRSVTPPGVVVSSPTLPAPSSISSQQKEITAIVDKPKPPQRKRRPAPKPPQIIETKEIDPPTTTQTTTTTTATEVETTSTTKKLETGLTICHSRNSSDSSGYHEASVLSDNCGNTSLPRRPRSTTIDTNDHNNNRNNGRIIAKFSQSTSNLSKMSIQSKSTSSLSITGRKKKTAPPPPPPVVKQANSTNVDNHKQPPSPVVASQNTITAAVAAATTTINIENPKIQDLQGDGPVTNPNPPQPALRLLHDVPTPAPRSKILNNTPISNDNHNSTSSSSTTIENNIDANPDRLNELQPDNEEKQVTEAINQTVVETTNTGIINNDDDDDHKESIELEQKPEIVEVIPKNNPQSMFDSLTRKRGFQIGSSLLNADNNNDETNSQPLNTDVNNNNNNNDDELITNDELFDVSLKTDRENTIILNQLHGIHDYDDGHKSRNFQKTLSVSSLRSVTSIPGFLGSTNMKKWDNIEELDDISLQSVKWVIGGDKNTDFPDVANSIQKLDDKVEEKPVSVIESSGKTELDDPNNLNEEIIHSGGGGDLETQEWQYQLPSPPKAFRDSSPPSTFANFNDNSAADSVVTSPELFEKLQSISDNQTDKADSNFGDIGDNKSILNKLSLENLEKRKSLVYNRELATSLKQQQQHEEEPQEANVEKDRKTTRTEEDYVDILMKFEKTLDELQQKTTTSSHQSQPQQQQRKETITKSALPNFKITTYDNPKQKLNIFEDDTIRSNRKFDKNNKKTTTTTTTQIRRNSNDGKSPSSLLRTESFQQNHWSPVRPVTRSKSSVALNKYNQNNKRDDYICNQLNNNNEENLIKSNSLFDVSGLQSLGVMRLIQSKLNTPMNSIGENLNTADRIVNNNNNNNENNNKNYQTQSDDKTEVQNNNNNNNFNSSHNNKTEKSYQYISTTPSINMGTWSERPKIPVNLKSDPDYKFNNNNNHNNKNNNNSNSNNNNNNRRFSPVYNNGVNVRISSEYKNVSIKVNGSEPISAENSGNVVIKIGEQQQQQTRKPLGNINKMETNKQRPHSIAFDSGFDVSRLPVVRSVELKKPYKDLQNNNNNNTSITQINENKSNATNKHSNIDRNNETLSVQQQQQQIEPKFRLNSFVQNSAPVVRGFRHSDNYRFSWNQPHSYSSTSTLKNKEQSSSSSSSSSQQQQQSPFQVNLRRTESTKINDLDKKMMPAPPPPPPPVVASLRSQQSSKSARSADNCGVDPKEQLLQAIRDFGGKKGLRALKA